MITYLGSTTNQYLWLLYLSKCLKGFASNMFLGGGAWQSGQIFLALSQQVMTLDIIWTNLHKLSVNSSVHLSESSKWVLRYSIKNIIVGAQTANLHKFYSYLYLQLHWQMKIACLLALLFEEYGLILAASWPPWISKNIMVSFNNNFFVSLRNQF